MIRRPPRSTLFPYTNALPILAEQEELEALRPDLDGNQIMSILGIPPGRDVGRAYSWLLERRIEEGPLGEDRAREELLRSEEHTSELQSRQYLVCRLLLEKKKT